MRSLECSITAEARYELIDVLLGVHGALRVSRRQWDDEGLSEAWRTKGFFRYRSFYFHREKADIHWKVLFGFEEIPIIERILERHSECKWIWPEGGISEPVTPESQSESGPRD